MVRGNTRRVCGRQVCNDRIAASSPLVRASLVRLTTTRRHRGRGRIFLRFSTDWSRLLSSNFPFFPLPFYPFLRLLSFETKELFFRRGAKKNWCWVFRWMSFYVWGVCCPESNCSSSVEYFSSFRKRRNDFLARRSFRVDEFFFLNSWFK